MIARDFFEKSEQPCVALLGRFDGLHVGHMHLVKEGLELKKRLGVPLLAFTFLPSKKKQILLLNEQRALEASVGIDGVLEAPETAEFYSIKAKEFLRLLKENHSPVGIVCGEDYSFGFEREGNASLLKDYFEPLGVIVEVVPIFCVGGEKISSSDIRKRLEIGDIVGANERLGYNFFIEGKVERGRGDGRLFGYPTANILPDDNKMLPKEGVYATRTTVDGKTYDSVTNVGAAPTFSSAKKTTETFILGFNGDLYEKTVRVFFTKRIRDIKKFSSKDELYARITEDIKCLK